MCKLKGEGGLGFNLALLAKQGWRLIHQQSSLASQIFKANYYPQTDFLLALMKKNSSYCWRSRAEARKIIRAGARWRVGDGATIKVLVTKEKFLPSAQSYPGGNESIGYGE